MRLLALDIATKTGWAVFEDGQRSASGVWDLNEGAEKGESPDERIARKAHALKCALVEIFDDYLGEFDQLAYEDAPFNRSGGDARIAWLRLVPITFAYTRCVDLIPIHPATAKKALTGNGHADKAEMISSAESVFGCEIEDDNEADSLAVGLAAIPRFG